MSVDPPESASLRSVAERYGLGLADADLAAFSPMVDGLLASWTPSRSSTPHPPAAAPERSWHRPDARRQPASTPGTSRPRSPASGEGPLAGKTVAVKDNTAVAGRADDERLARRWRATCPLRDATVVTRMLAAGATIAGKAVCEDLCFSGG